MGKSACCEESGDVREFHSAWKMVIVYEYFSVIFRVRTIPVLGYWVLGDTCMYWVVSVSGDIFFGRDTRYCCPLINKRRRPHDNHLNWAERSSMAEHGEGSEGVGRVAE